MPENKLTTESDFAVKESLPLLYVASAALITICLYCLFNNYGDNKTYMNMKAVIIFLLPAIPLLAKAYYNKTSIRVNKNGIFYYGNLITNWANFLNANFEDKEITRSIQDNFVLTIEYNKPNESGYFMRQIPLINTQDKSEEDIIAAIEFFATAHYNGLC